MLSVCGRGLEDFLFIHLKSPWTAFHGSWGCGVFIKRPTQRSGWAWKMGLLFLILIEKYRNLLSISSSIMLLIN